MITLFVSTTTWEDFDKLTLNYIKMKTKTTRMYTVENIVFACNRPLSCKMQHVNIDNKMSFNIRLN